MLEGEHHVGVGGEVYLRRDEPGIGCVAGVVDIGRSLCTIARILSPYEANAFGKLAVVDGEASEVLEEGHIENVTGGRLGRHAAGEVCNRADLEVLLVGHQNTGDVIGLAFLGRIAQAELVVHLNAGAIGVAIPVVSVLTECESLDGDEVAGIVHVGLSDGQFHGLGGTSGSGGHVDLEVVASHQFGHVVVDVELALDGSVEHLVGLVGEAGVVEVDGSAGVAHEDVFVISKEYLGVLELQRGFIALVECLESSNVHGLVLWRVNGASAAQRHGDAVQLGVLVDGEHHLVGASRPHGSFEGAC